MHHLGSAVQGPGQLRKPQAVRLVLLRVIVPAQAPLVSLGMLPFGLILTCGNEPQLRHLDCKLNLLSCELVLSCQHALQHRCHRAP